LAKEARVGLKSTKTDVFKEHIMSQAAIENPVINSPFGEPRRHFRFAENDITNEIVPGRRRSTYFIPIAKPKLKGAQKQGMLDLNIQHRAEENKLINDLRERVSRWRQAGRPYTIAVTRRLLDHWTRPNRERRLFFCQIEAVETIIYLIEIAPRRQPWHVYSQRLRQANAQATLDGYTACGQDGGWPYEKLQRALKAELDEAAWSELYSTNSRPFNKPETGKIAVIAVKVVNHYGIRY